jgi:acetolactate synthase I/II/III large subunit
MNDTELYPMNTNFSPAQSRLNYSPVAYVLPNTRSGTMFQRNSQKSPSVSVAALITKMLEDLGVQYAFGVSGGAIAPLWDELQHSSLQVLHFRHEAGAAFAAAEAYFASGQPVVVFTTTGPGITNALTGLFAARWEGAKVIFLSASTSASHRGRWAIQETSTYTMPSSGVFTSGTMFNYATTLESSDELPEVSRRLALGLAQPGSFVVHLSVPTAIQASSSKVTLPPVTLCHSLVSAPEETILDCAKLLSEGPFAIWVGFGARGASAAIRQLAERTGAAVMCSPRAKGIFPEDHPQFVGVTGVGGQESAIRYMQSHCPLRVLVLGTRLGERTSLWNPAMVPERGFVHVDINPGIPGTAYPSAETFAIQSDVEVFVTALLKHFKKCPNQSIESFPRQRRDVITPSAKGVIRPEVLMDAIQHVFVDRNDVLVMVEPGSSSVWGNHRLQFTKPGYYRASSGFASMGHAVTGVLGAALGRNGKAVAIVGDGAMLMNNEVSTAVRYQIPAVWIVLNDGRYNMCVQGMAALGFQDMDATIPPVNFVQIACGMGADGICVENESDLQRALEKALVSPSPFVVDVMIDPTRPLPIGSRVKSLMSQGATNS